MDRSEKELLDLIGHAVFVLEPGEDGLPRYVAYNEFACSVLGKPEHEILNLTAQELFPGRFGKIALTHHLEVMQTAQECSYELVLPLAKGQCRIRTTLKPALDAQGRVRRIVGSATDMTGNQLLREMQVGTHTLNAEMEDFINLAAHDLRAPMRHVTAIADLLREDFTDMGDGKLELIDMLEEVGSKAMALIGDVLSHAQTMATGEEEVTFDFDELVRDIMGLMDPMARCGYDVSGGVVVGNRTATQMILRNLIDNAIKSVTEEAKHDATPDDLHLTISVEDADGFFDVTVRDNGAGFGNTAMMFLNGGKLNTDSGFGMLGVRRLINARGGHLSAGNETGRKGAKVTFSLPGRVVGPL